MKKIIPYTKDIVFKTNIASITSISLEHNEKVNEGEISGDFVIFGDYKIHNDTTEKELFKYKLPYEVDYTDNIDKETITIDIEDFTYEIKEQDVLRVNIQFSLNAEELPIKTNEEDKDQRSILVEEDNDNIENLIDENVAQKVNDYLNDLETEENKLEQEKKDTAEKEEILREIKEFEKELSEPIVVEDDVNDKRNVNEIIKKEEETEHVAKEEVIETVNNEYVTYHIHIIKENETLEDIMKIYECSIDDIKMYNDINKIIVGDKIIIPEIIND